MPVLLNFSNFRYVWRKRESCSFFHSWIYTPDEDVSSCHWCRKLIRMLTHIQEITDMTAHHNTVNSSPAQHDSPGSQCHCLQNHRFFWVIVREWSQHMSIRNRWLTVMNKSWVFLLKRPELSCIKHSVAIVKVHYTTMHTKAQIQTFSDWGTSFTLSYKSKYFRREKNFLRNLFELTLTLIQKKRF